jgi:hypothetical protein
MCKSTRESIKSCEGRLSKCQSPNYAKYIDLIMCYSSIDLWSSSLLSVYSCGKSISSISLPLAKHLSNEADQKIIGVMQSEPNSNSIRQHCVYDCDEVSAEEREVWNELIGDTIFGMHQDLCPNLSPAGRHCRTWNDKGQLWL